PRGRHDQEHHVAGPRHPAGSQRPSLAGQAAGDSQAVAIARGREGMTVTRGAALFLSVALAGTLAKAAAPAGPAAGPRLTAISSRVHNKGASLVIEATSPVPYVTTRPDPLTVFVDFRNVGAEGLANSVARNAKSPIAGVVVEAADALGAPTSRVRITLSQPVAYRARSDRNTIVLDFDKPS